MNFQRNDTAVRPKSDDAPSSARSRHLVVFGRYVLVSLAGAVANFLCYWALLSQTSLLSWVAALLSAGAVIGPRFIMSRQWIWRDSAPGGQASRQFVGFTALTAIGVATATVVSAGLGQAGVGDLLMAVSNSAVYVAVWLARFFLLDRLFTATAR